MVQIKAVFFGLALACLLSPATSFVPSALPHCATLRTHARCTPLGLRMQGTFTLGKDSLGKASFDSMPRTDGTTWVGKGKKSETDAPAPLDEKSKEFCRAFVDFLAGALELVYAGADRDIARFYVLETVAREPYFAYMWVLHLYESFGMHNRASWIKVHYAEEDNEVHHLMIMQALGGSEKWFDRFFAKHSALAYFFFNVVFYFVHPRVAYYFMSLIEDHAWKTYSTFVAKNKEKLMAAPAPPIAKKYYEAPDQYLREVVHSSLSSQTLERRKMQNLYDVFCAIRDDEEGHRAILTNLVEVGKVKNTAQQTAPPPQPSSGSLPLE